MRRIPAALAATPAAAVADALRVARGAPRRWSRPAPAPRCWSAPASLEQLVRAFARASPSSRAIVLADAGDAGRLPAAAPRAPATRRRPAARRRAPRGRRGPRAARARSASTSDDPVGSIVRRLSWERAARRPVAPCRPATAAPAAAPAARPVRAPPPARPRGSGERLERTLPRRAPPSVPVAARRARFAAGPARRPWTPAESARAVPAPRAGGEERRDHRPRACRRRASSSSTTLGCVHRFQAPGLGASCARGGPEGFEAIPDPGDGAPSVPGPLGAAHARLRRAGPLPLLETLELAFHPPSDAVGAGQRRRRPAAGRGDRAPPPRLRRGVPDQPAPPAGRRARGSACSPLLRTVDGGARRHRRRRPARPPRASCRSSSARCTTEPQDGLDPALDRRRPRRDRRRTAPAPRARARADARSLGGRAADVARPAEPAAGGAGPRARRDARSPRRAAARRRARRRRPAARRLPVAGARRRTSASGCSPPCTRSPATSWSRRGRWRPPTWATARRRPLGWAARLAPVTGSLEPAPGVRAVGVALRADGAPLSHAAPPGAADTLVRRRELDPPTPRRRGGRRRAQVVPPPARGRAHAQGARAAPDAQPRRRTTSRRCAASRSPSSRASSSASSAATAPARARC